MLTDAEARIAQCLRDKSLVPVVGAGASAAIGRLPSWARLIASGFDFVEQLGTWPRETLQEARAAFHPDDATALIRAARQLKDLLGAPDGEFPAWLQRVFAVHREECSLELLNAIADLLAPVVATTNYDKLLSIFHPNPEAITWQDSAAMADLFHGGGKVLHLHGVYDRPGTIVFGADDYDRLVQQPAYRAVLQTLWLDRTLLFVGCSLDGLQDPDFLRFIEWTTKMFRGLSHEHYALVRTGELKPELRRQLLHESRIMTVEYGEPYSDLPRWFAAVNPNVAAARDLRVARTRELLESGTLAEFAATMSGLTPKSAPAEVSLYAESARPLFERHARSLTRERNELVALQKLARAMVNESEVRAALEAWSEKRVSEQWSLFYRTALAAGDVLFVFERRVLARLWRLDTGVHTYAATGELSYELDHARRFPDLARHDRYTQENLARILRSLVYIFDIDATVLFPDPEPGQHIPQGMAALVVIRPNGIELRALIQPKDPVGFLPETPPKLHGVAAAVIGGAPVLIAYNPERITAWDPYKIGLPVAEFRLDQLPLDEQDLVGIYNVAHHASPNGLVSSVIVGRNVHWLLDLVYQGSTDVKSKGFSGQLWLSGHRLFAVDRTRIVRIDHDGEHTLLTAKDLLVQLRGLPQPPPPEVELDNFRLLAVTVDGRPILGVRARMKNGLFGSAIALIDPEANPAQLIGGWVLPKEVAVSCTATTDSDGSTLLFACCLQKSRDNEELRDLVRCARGVHTNRGLVFVEERSGVPTENDLFDIVVTAGKAGFVVDTAGSLLQFDLDSGIFSEIEPRGRALGVSRFPMP